MDEDKEFVGFLYENCYSYDFEWSDGNDKCKKEMTEDTFLEQKKTWKPKIEDKYILSKTPNPIPRPADKFSLAILKSAAEEQYYLRNYQKSLDYVNDLLKPKDSNLKEDYELCEKEKKQMNYLRNKCLEKLLT
ncbi:hypothetical protein PNEG_03317 [Pneumocystis murina B123]|uniref:Uncharacterized protein n=1 Tax=Pneumocystis murina (strain B123) TaxID=1069680 RepID=M7NMY7_PNEMU|nr:hypothetical protein PNEG_03317 [Pneumocystis murina B123]EMR08491.1 hypothetical protein PNEG_03317 [Pneumocystis murina B123]